MRERIEDMAGLTAARLAAALRSSAREATDWRDGLRLVAEVLEGKHDDLTPDAVAKLREIAAEYSAAGSERAAGYISSAADEVAEMVPTLDALIQSARERGPMPDAERQAQRESYVRGEMALGSDRDEAAFRAANTGPELTRNHDFGAGDDGWQARPIPADVRDVVREALRETLHAAKTFAQAVREDSGLGYPWPALEIAEDNVRAALAALDAAPAEGETLGYGGINDDVGMLEGFWSPHYKQRAREWRRHAPVGWRLVRLVAEDGDE